MDGPLLWFLNRGTGFTLMVLLTATVLLGILATRGAAGGRMPRFATQSLHRNLGLLSVLMLLAHVTSAVADEYVDIRWWQALSPLGATYRPLWLGLGTLALDLMVLVTLTSLLRPRIGHRLWLVVHLGSYAAWAAAVAHGLGIGTDSSQPWALWLTWACVGLVVLAGLGRAVTVGTARRRARASRTPGPLAPVAVR